MLLRGPLSHLRSFTAAVPVHARPSTSSFSCACFRRGVLVQAAHSSPGGSPATVSAPLDLKRDAAAATAASSTAKSKATSSPNKSEFLRENLFIPPGVDLDDVTQEMVLPGSNIVVGPYAGDARIKQVEFLKSSPTVRDCPKDDRPEFAIVGRSNVGKSSLVNALVRKKEIALTSKKPGKTQMINHFLINKSWYLVDLPGYGFANAPDSIRMDWSVFTKGFFLNRKTLVSVLLLVDASTPSQQIDLDCANWLGRNNVPLTFVFTKCDKRKNKKGNLPDENIRNFLNLVAKYYPVSPPWIMTSSVTGFGRDELLLHMSQLRNYWENY